MPVRYISQNETTCGDIVIITDEAITVSEEGRGERGGGRKERWRRKEGEVKGEGRRGEGRRKGGRTGEGEV